MQFEIVEHVLEAGLQSNVSNLFRREDYKTLKRVIEGLAKKKLAEASNKAIESSKYPNYAGSGDDLLTQAKRYNDVLDVLKELEEQKEVFKVFTVK